MILAEVSTWIVLIPAALALIAPYLTYRVQAKKQSGNVQTSDAANLWARSERMLDQAEQRLARSDEKLKDAENKLAEADKHIDHLTIEIEALRAESVAARQESLASREEMIQLSNNLFFLNSQRITVHSSSFYYPSEAWRPLLGVEPFHS